MEQTKYDVFISYSRKDYMDDLKNVIPGNDVSKIKNALTEAGITYWFDEEGIYSGQNFVEKIVTNIENAKIFLFLSSFNANNSPWTCKEIASADEFKKHIIPIRIDPTPYNKKVLFRIADLDFIDYYVNPQKALEDLLKSIKTYLDELAAEEERKKEDERKLKELEQKKKEELKFRKEQEEKRRQEEQKRLISEIRLSCTKLNNEEAKLEIDRESLFLSVERVTDSSQRDALKDMIKTGGTIRQKYQKELRAEIIDKEKQISQLQSEVESSKYREDEQSKTIDQLTEQVGLLQKELNNLQKNAKTIDANRGKWLRVSVWVHVCYWIAILSILVVAIVWLVNIYNESELWEYRYNHVSNESYRLNYELSESNKAKETLSLLSGYVPFVVTDIEVKNDGDDWGNKIYSSKSTYFRPRIKYIGIKEGSYNLGIKIYCNNSLSQGKSSPNGYSYFENTSIEIGENYSEQIGGWGNKDVGNWPAGNYRIEIWYKEMKLSEKTFVVY